MTLTREYQAARLLYWGLQVKTRPINEPEYERLVSKYREDADFRRAVHDVTDAFELSVISVSDHGIALAPNSGSPFAFSHREFRQRRFQSADERLLDGLIQPAIAATVFPRAEDLEDDATLVRPPFSAADVETTLENICQRLSDAAKGQDDPTADSEARGLYEAWRVYKKLGRTRASNSIQFHLERMKGLGLLTSKVSADGKYSYQSTWHYQVQVKEFAASRFFQIVSGDFQRTLSNATNHLEPTQESAESDSE